MAEPFDQAQVWTISAAARPGEVGEGVVAIKAENALFGLVIDRQMRVDWKPGMEATDVEMVALALLRKAAVALGDECLHLAVLKRDAA